jgi:hypothetical protein
VSILIVVVVEEEEENMSLDCCHADHEAVFLECIGVVDVNSQPSFRAKFCASGSERRSCVHAAATGRKCQMLPLAIQRTSQHLTYKLMSCKIR